MLGANRAHQNDALLSFGDSTPSAPPLPASQDNREVDHPPRDCSKETTLSCNCFCKAMCHVPAALGHSLLITNRLRELCKPSVKKSLATQSLRPTDCQEKAGNSAPFNTEALARRKGLTFVSQPSALRTVTPASLGASPGGRACGGVAVVQDQPESCQQFPGCFPRGFHAPLRRSSE